MPCRLPASSPTADFLTLAETAAALKVNERTVRRYIADGRLRAERVGPRLIRVDAASVAGLTRSAAVYSDDSRRRVSLRDAALEDFKQTMTTAGVIYAQSETHPARRADALTVYKARAVEAVMDLDVVLRAIDAEAGAS